MVFSLNQWVGKVAIVTGASTGIGAAIAKKLVDQGLQVVGLSRRSELVEDLSKQLQHKKGKLYAIKTDISKEEEILKAFNWASNNLGNVHVLINNAGIMQPTTLTEGETDKWRKIFEINVLGLCIATREAVKIMKANKIDGHIVHINSLAGHSVPALYHEGINVYPASKHAVTALTETLRQEFNHLGLKIKITSISPGFVATKIIQNNSIRFDSNLYEESKKAPYLQSEDVADSVLYVLSTPPHVQVHELIIKPVGEKF